MPFGVLLSSFVMKALTMVFEGCGLSQCVGGGPGVTAGCGLPTAGAAEKAAMLQLLRDVLSSGLWLKAAEQLHLADDEGGE